MERIQSAISKAREARQVREAKSGRSVAAPPPLPDVTAEQLAAADPVSRAWDGLMEFHPDARALERNRLVSLSGNAASAPFDSLRTRLLYLIRDKGWRRVAVTSPGPECGKTTVTANLSLSLSRLPDVRTVVIDADLRRPALGKTLGVSAGHQIADVLAGKADPSSHLLRVGQTLAVGTNRSAVPNSAELLQSPRARQAIELIEETFQPNVLIVDLPPILVSDDAIAALGLMDCVIMVAAAEATTIQEIDRCEHEISQRSNVVGVVLNKCRYLEKSEGYGYGYY